MLRGILGKTICSSIQVPGPAECETQQCSPWEEEKGPQQPAEPQYANYWALLTRKRHIPPRPAQPQHTNHWAPRTRQ